MLQRDFAGAAARLEEGLRRHQPDDWAGLLLLMSCLLPGTALPFGEAAEGVFEIEGGFGGVSEQLGQAELWQEAAEAQGEAERGAAVQRVIALLDELTDAVRAAKLLLHRTVITDMYVCLGALLRAWSHTSAMQGVLRLRVHASRQVINKGALLIQQHR